MKPIRLRMTAFGPYPGTEVVDFDKFQGHLFLIFGPTGSGKTTIFDAICYALYNKTSGDLRSGEEMCSDHVEEGTPTEVEFDFSVGQKLYRVRRCPPQLRAKARGSGFSKVKAEVQFYDQTGAAGNEDGTLLGTGLTAVREKVKEILGFEADQFRQVVLIPQGDFRKLLTAKSDEREKILKVLFRTAIYTKIQEELKGRVKALGEGCKEKMDTRSGLLESKDCKILEQLIEKLETLVGEGKAFVKEKEKQKAAFDKAMDAYTKTEKTNSRFIELEEALKEKEVLAQDKKLFDGKRKEFELAVKARGLEDVKGTRDKAKKALEKAGKDCDEAEKENQQAAKASKGALAEQAKTDKKQPDLQKFEKELVSYEGMRPKVKVLGGLREDLEVSQSELTKWVKECKGQEKELVDVEKSIKKEQGLLESSQKDAGREGELQLKANAARENLVGRKNYDEAESTFKDVGKEIEKVEGDLRKREKALKEADDNLAKVETSWEESRVRFIAGTLEEGQPCPVCGSTEHPVPADDGSTDEVIGDEDLQQARDTQKDAAKGLTTVRENSNKLSLKAKNLKGTIDQLGAKDEIKKLTVEMQEAQIQSIEEELESAGEAEVAVGKLQKSLRALEKQRAKAEKSVGELRETIKSREIEISKNEATIKEKTAGISKELLDEETLEKKYQSIVDEKESLEESIEKNRKAARNAEKTAAEKKGRYEELLKSLEKMKSSSDEAEKTFVDRLQGEGFASENAFEEALREKADVARLDQEVKAHDKEQAANRKRVARAKKETKDIKRPNLDQAKEKRDEAQEQSVKAEKALTKHEEEVSGYKDVKSKVERITREVARQEKKMEVFSRLSDVANGGGAAGAKITFQRYVLAGILDDVTIAATERLRRMSVDRYELRRAANAKDKRSVTGLDLEVFDDHTGESRSVKTLSGGEMFLASLSLALGLSDVVQAYSGGIHLDSIFIDEGFGSLDSETLDQAIDTLVALNKGGRMVGVISHVGELKERIDLRIEVQSSAKGSKVLE